MNKTDTGYSIVSPENFTVEQRTFVDEFKNAVRFIFSQTDKIMGAKDVSSRHIISTDAYAHIVSLANGMDVIDRFDKEMPCEGTAQFAEL